MRTMFIIPGFKEQATDERYAWLRDFLVKKGFVVKPVPIQWDYRTMSDYIDEFEQFFAAHRGVQNYFLGFSYGAVIAFSTAQELQPEKIYLCSLSPDFKEDVKGMEEWIKKYIGVRRLADCQQRSGREIAKQLTVPTVLLYGEKEAAAFPHMKTRIRETERLAHDATVIEVLGALHDISVPAYQAAIKKLF